MTYHITKHFIIVCVFFCFINSVSATHIRVEQLPIGCDATGYEFQNSLLVLNDTGKQHLYLIQNKTSIPIEIKYKPKKPIFMNIGYQTRLNQSRWAALATDEKEMPFECFNASTNKSLQCDTLIRVCLYRHAKFSLSNRGIYWVSRNTSLQQSKRLARAKGIWLRR